MAGDIIRMDDMEGVFSITDAFSISREAVSVPLGKADPGAVVRLQGGTLEIVVPLTLPLADFLLVLREKLLDMGYEAE